MNMLIIGPFKFSQAGLGFSNLRERSTQALPRLDLIGAQPILQNLGPSVSEKTLSGTCWPLATANLVDWPSQLMAMLGKAYMVINGRGEAWPDRWAIKELELEKTGFLNNGSPRKIRYTMTLERA